MSTMSLTKKSGCVCPNLRLCRFHCRLHSVIEKISLKVPEWGTGVLGTWGVSNIRVAVHPLSVYGVIERTGVSDRLIELVSG